MEEFYVNDYVIKVEGGHPGKQVYTLIATPETWLQLSAQLNFALKSPTAKIGALKNVDGDMLLLEKYATISKGKTERVYLCFYAAEDLAAHHARPNLFQRFYDSFYGCGLMVLSIVVPILYLAAVGLSKLYGDYINAP